jgi:hypothetical protein
LGKVATVFQTKIYAILQRTCENIRRAYKHKQILIFSYSQTALKVLSSLKVTLGLGAECLDAFSALDSLNEVIFMWVPGHCGIPASEKADKLARQVSAMLLLGPETALGIPRCSAREAIKNWTEYKYYSTQKDVPGHRHGKLFIGRPCKTRTEDLLKLIRPQLKMAAAVLTAHAIVRRHLYIMRLFDRDPTCRFCRMETETVQHIICYCEVLARQRYNVFGKLFAEPKDISTASVRDLCRFI